MKKSIFVLLLLCSGQPAIAMEALIKTQKNQRYLNEQLVLAVETNNVNRVKSLLAAGADANAQEKKNEYTNFDLTVLQRAGMNGNVPICQLLLEHGANVNGTDSNGSTALMASTHQSEICELLLNHGADVNARMVHGYNALCYAAQGNKDPYIAQEAAKVCILLIEHGADFTDEGNPFKRNALFTAAQFWGGQKNICIQIIKCQKQINAAIKTTLLCLNRLKNNNEWARLLYRHFNTLLKPHMGRYIPIEQLLNVRDGSGKRAYDYLPIDCLNPEKVNEPESGWLSNCSVQ